MKRISMILGAFLASMGLVFGAVLPAQAATSYQSNSGGVFTAYRMPASGTPTWYHGYVDLDGGNGYSSFQVQIRYGSTWGVSGVAVADTHVKNPEWQYETSYYDDVVNSDERYAWRYNYNSNVTGIQVKFSGTPGTYYTQFCNSAADCKALAYVGSFFI